MSKPRVLCVDDEPSLLEGLDLSLGRKFRLQTASGGEEALSLMESSEPFAVVISDMRMPGMNGAAFLTHVRERSPDTTRMLLTGQTDMESAIAAVNEGQIFRFLTKPVQPKQLVANVTAAVEQHRLVRAERELLQETLHGSIKALTDVLALTHPLAFGRSTRLRQTVSAMAKELSLTPSWPLEIAAMVSQLGCITLPEATAKKVYFGHPLSADEQKTVDGLPDVVGELLGNIPRLDPVLEILAPKARELDDTTRVSRELLRLANDFDVLVSRGMSDDDAISTLEGRFRDYAATSITALRKGRAQRERRVLELPIAKVTVGMVFIEDVRTESGALLVARGHEVSAGFVTRAKSFRRGYVREPVRVSVPSEAA